MKSETKHTPGPLLSVSGLNLRRNDRVKVFATVDCGHYPVNFDQALADAAEIVRRWNAHEQLAEVLRDLSDSADCAAEWLLETSPGTDQWERGQALLKSITKAKQALALLDK